MISRRGFFGMLAGLAAAPVLAPLAKLFPETAPLDGWASYRVTYTMSPSPSGWLKVRRIRGEQVFQCGSGNMGTLWWSKENS